MADLLVPPFWDWSPSLIDDRAAAMVSTGSPIIIPGWPDWTSPRTVKGQAATFREGINGEGNGYPLHQVSPYGPLWRFQGNPGTNSQTGVNAEIDGTAGEFQVGTGPFTIMAAFHYLGTNSQINNILCKKATGSAAGATLQVNNFNTGDGSLICEIRPTDHDVKSSTGLISAGDYGVAIVTRDSSSNMSLWWRGIEVATGSSTNNINNSEGVAVAGFSDQAFMANCWFLIGGLWERALTNAEKTLLSFDPMILVRPDMAKLLPMMLKAPAAGNAPVPGSLGLMGVGI